MTIAFSFSSFKAQAMDSSVIENQFMRALPKKDINTIIYGDAGADIRKHTNDDGSIYVKFNSYLPHIPAITNNEQHLLLASTKKSVIDDENNDNLDHIASKNILSKGGTWLKYIYDEIIQDIAGTTPGYQVKIDAFLNWVLTTQLEDDQDTQIGIAYTYVLGSAEQNENNKIESENHIFNLYSSHIEGNFFFNGRLSYSFGG